MNAPRYVDLRTVARRLGIGLATAAELCRLGGLPAKLSAGTRRWWVRESDLKAFQRKQRRQQVA